MFLTKIASVLFDLLHRPPSLFEDASLTLSQKERHNILLRDETKSRSWLRKLTGWNSAEYNQAKIECRSSKDEVTPNDVHPIQEIPVYRFDIIWVGKVKGTSFIVVETNIPTCTLENWIRNLAEPDKKKLYLERCERCYQGPWRRLHKVLDAFVKKNLETQGWTRLVKDSVRRKDRVLFVGGKIRPIGEFSTTEDGTTAPSPNMDIVKAIAMLAFAHCKLRWLVPEEFDPSESEVSLLVSTSLYRGFDAGIKWSQTSSDGTLCTLNMPDGMPHLLGRPGQPLVESSGPELFDAIGCLVPNEHHPVALQLEFRKRGAGLGLMLHNLSQLAPFCAALVGVAPAMRRVVVRRAYLPDLTSAAAVEDLLTVGARQEIVHSAQKSSAVMAAMTLVIRERHKQWKTGRGKCGNHAWSFIFFLHSLGVTSAFGQRPSGRKDIFPFVALIKKRYRTGILPSLVPPVIKTAKLFIRGGIGILQNVCPTRASLPNSEKAERLIVGLRSVKSDLRTRKDETRRSLGLAELKNLALGMTPYNILSGSELDGPLRSSENEEATSCSMRDLWMINAKVKFGALALESRTTRWLEKACDFTLHMRASKLLRLPDNDFEDLPNWISTSPVCEGSIVVDLLPLLTMIMQREVLKAQVEAVKWTPKFGPAVKL